MRKLLLVDSTETIELSYPDNLSDFMTVISPHLKARTVKLNNGAQIDTLIFDEINMDEKSDAS